MWQGQLMGGRLMFLTIRDAKLSLGNLNDVTGTAMSQQLKMGGPYAAKNR